MGFLKYFCILLILISFQFHAESRQPATSKVKIANPDADFEHEPDDFKVKTKVDNARRKPDDYGLFAPIKTRKTIFKNPVKPKKVKTSVEKTAEKSVEKTAADGEPQVAAPVSPNGQPYIPTSQLPLFPGTTEQPKPRIRRNSTPAIKIAAPPAQPERNTYSAPQPTAALPTPTPATAPTSSSPMPPPSNTSNLPAQPNAPVILPATPALQVQPIQSTNQGSSDLSSENVPNFYQLSDRAVISQGDPKFGKDTIRIIDETTNTICTGFLNSKMSCKNYK